MAAAAVQARPEQAGLQGGAGGQARLHCQGGRGGGQGHPGLALLPGRLPPQPRGEGKEGREPSAGCCVGQGGEGDLCLLLDKKLKFSFAIWFCT